MTFWKVMPPGDHNTFWGQNNIKNEFSSIKLLRMQIFSKIQQLLKNHYLGGFLTELELAVVAVGRVFLCSVIARFIIRHKACFTLQLM